MDGWATDPARSAGRGAGSGDVFDWATDEGLGLGPGGGEVVPAPGAPAPGAPAPGAPAATRANPINGHVPGCCCAQCPGWYLTREGREARGAAVDVGRRPLAEVGGGVPVWVATLTTAVVLMAMVTVCGLVLLPVVIPLVQTLAVGVIGVGVAVVALAVVTVVLASVAAKSGVLGGSDRGAPRRWGR